MATFSKTPPKSKSVFRKTENPLSDQELQSKNQQAANLIAEYNSRIAKGDYMSADDLAAYKNATNEYIGTGNSMIKRSGNQADTANWQQIVADINDRYNTVYNEYSKYASKEDWDSTVAANKASAAAYQASLDFDIDAGKQRLAALQGVTKDARYTQYLNDRQLVSAYEANPSAYPYSEQQMKALSNSVMELEDRYGFAPRDTIDTEVSSLQKQIADAETIQALSALEKSTMAMPDFEAKSGYVSTVDANGNYDTEYEMINHRSSGKDVTTLADDWATYLDDYGATMNQAKEYEYLTKMSDDEVKVYNYLINNNDKEGAKQYLSLLENELHGRRQADTAAIFKNLADSAPVLADVISVMMSPAKGTAYLSQLGEYLVTGKVNENAAYNDVLSYSSNIRSARGENISKAWDKALGENWGKVGNFGYQLGMSMGDFLLAAGISGGNEAMALGIMGTGAAADTTIAAKKRGLDDNQAIALGTIAGAAEVVSEKIGWDALFDEALKNSSKLTYLLKNAFSEAAEEPTSSVINTLADLIISGDQAELRLEAQELIDSGMDADEAWGKVFGNYALSLGVDALGGLLSGAAMGGGSLAINTIATNHEQKKEYTELGQKIIDDGDVKSLQDIVASLPTNDSIAKLSEFVAKKATPASVGKLYSEVAPMISEQTTAELKAKLQEAGISNRESSKAAIIFSKAVFGQQMTDTEIEIMDGLLKSKKFADVFESVLGDPESVTSKRIASFVAANTKKATEKAEAKTKEEAAAMTAKKTAESVDLAKTMKVTEVGKNASISINGEESVSLADADFKNNGHLAVAYHAVTSAEGMTTKAANMILGNAKAFTPGFIQQALAAYTGGINNVQNIAEKLDVSVIDADEARALFEAGREAAKSSSQAAEDNVYNVYQRAKGVLQKTGAKPKGKLRIAEDVDVDSFNNAQTYTSMLVAELAPMLSVDIVLYNGTDRLTFGYYKASEDAIYLNVNSRWNKNSMMLFTMSHELVHRAKLGSPKQYKAFADYLIAEYGKAGVSIEDLVNQQIDAASAAGVSLTYDEAFEEVVCDAAQRMLSDTDAGKKLTEWGAKSKENASIVAKIKELLTELFDMLRKYFKHADSDSDAANAFRKLDKNVQQILADLFVDMSTTAAERLSTIKAAGMTEKITTGDGGVKHKFRGYAEDGKGIYESNFQKGTPKRAKGERVLKYIQDVWSKKPITLRIEENGKIRFIEAQFDPTYDESENIPSDASKLMGGNRHGNSSEQRVTLDLADDYYKIAEESRYNYSKEETGKDLETHDDVKWWHYFVNDIYFAEHGSTELVPYTVSINVKEKGTGNFFYSFSAERSEKNGEPSTQRTLHAVVNSSDEATANGKLSNESIRNPTEKVKKISSTDSDGNQLTSWQQAYFAESEAVDKNGNLLYLYHQTAEDITEFDPRHPGAGRSDYKTPFGIFLKRTDKDIGLKGKKQMRLYANAKNPLRAENREELVRKLRDVSHEYAAVCDEIAEMDRTYKKRVDDAGRKLNDYMIEWRQNNTDASRRAIYDDATYNELSDAEDALVDEWVAKDDKLSSEAKEIITAALIDAGYDSVFLTKDAGSFGRETDAIIVLNPNQVKSVDNKNPTDDPDIHRKISAMASRQMLADAFEGMIQSEDERKLVDTYRQYLNATEDIEAPLVEVRKQIAEKVKAKAPAAEIAALRKHAAAMQAALDANDAALLSMEAAKPLRALMDRASKAYAEERLEKQRKALSEKYQESRHKASDRRKESELRGKISRFKKNLQSTLEGKRGKNFVPRSLFSAMVDVCELIDTDTDLYKKDGSLNKAQQRRDMTRDRLRNLRDQYENLKDSPDSLYKGEFDEYVLAFLKQLEQTANGKSLSELSLNELEEMYRILKAINGALNAAHELIGWNEGNDVHAVSDAIVDEQVAIKDKRKSDKKNVFDAANNALQNASLSPIRNVERMAGYDPNSPLVKLMTDLETGMRKKNRFVMESYKMFELPEEDQQWFEDALEESGETYKDKNGNEFKTSLMQRMQAVLSYEREQANPKLHHLEKGGIIFADLELLRKGKLREAVSAKNAHQVMGADKMIPEFVREINADPRCVEYMKTARKFFNEKAKAAINEASMAVKHRLVATESAYIPFEVDQNEVTKEIDAAHDVQKTINSYGILADITNHAPQALIVTGLNNVVDRHIEQVGTVYGLSVPVRNFNKVWNAHSLTTSGQITVKGMLDEVWGQKAVKFIEQAVQDVQGPRKSDMPELVSKLRGNQISATFALNLAVVTKQIGSLYASNSELYTARNPAEMLANLSYTMAHYDEIAAEIDKYTATAWVRRQGLSDEELHTLITESRKTLAGKYVSKKLGNLHPAKWITAMDSAVAMALWKYCKEDVLFANPGYQEIMNRLGNKPDLTDAEKAELDRVWKAIAKHYDNVVEHTQSMSDSLHRPEIQKKRDAFSLMLGTFKTDLYQTSGQLTTAIGRVSANPTKENKKALGRAIYSVALSGLWEQMMTVAFGMLRYKMSRYKDEEDKVTAKSVLGRMSLEYFGNLMGYVMPLFGGEIIELVEAFATGKYSDMFDDIVFSGVNDLLTSLFGITGKLMNGKEVTVQQWKKLSGLALSLLGLPANNIIRIWDAIQKHIKDWADGKLEFDQ